MTRLIDADVLTDELIKGMEADTDKSVQTTFTKSVCMILCKAIEKQPTVDAVPVIRCQDCKYCETMTIFGKTALYSCTRKSPAVDVLPTDYCSKGGRKDGSSQ